ncbi:hypothetical protein SAMN05421872_116117 [Nocardioides lianchengensis]|uniref:Uncharacterized protein n=1 Tax=Nocardioides lianchengensis TaxID=1045774 RepID=A0A1G7AXG3_9ACTN|nr:hypothetical protein [Nocardioides lianchengensis]SDE19519.1 hypothetical protein SAMN05421872_116117 [Nocardioides lianchengensis]
MHDLHVINPLGATLRHYGREISDVMAGEGVNLSETTFFEPSHSGGSRWRWIWAYVSAIWSSRSSSQVIVLWPVLGYLDVVLLRVLGPPTTYLVMHDPDPLVRAVGYGRAARWLAAIFRGPTLIAHSDSAVRVLRGSRHTVAKVPHPVLRPDANTAASATGSAVRVLGQFKRDRNVDLLRALGPILSEDYELSIHGRGWPDVPGWKVQNEYVDETTLDRLIAQSSVILIPYTRFFQSGIAVRAVEVGTPVVGPRDSWLSELLPNRSEELPAGNDPTIWAESIRKAAIPANGELANQLHAQVYEEARTRWRELMLSKR